MQFVVFEYTSNNFCHASVFYVTNGGNKLLQLYSGAPAGGQAEPHTQIGNKRKPMSWFPHYYHGWRYCSWARTHHGDGAAILQIMVDRDMQPWFTVYLFDIGHPCYDQLTPVKTRYPLTSVTWPYHGLKFTAHRGRVFFWSPLLTKCWFFRLDRRLMSG